VAARSSRVSPTIDRTLRPLLRSEEWQRWVARSGGGAGASPPATYDEAFGLALADSRRLDHRFTLPSDPPAFASCGMVSRFARLCRVSRGDRPRLPLGHSDATSTLLSPGERDATPPPTRPPPRKQAREPPPVPPGPRPTAPARLNRPGRHLRPTRRDGLCIEQGPPCGPTHGTGSPARLRWEAVPERRLSQPARRRATGCSQAALLARRPIYSL